MTSKVRHPGELVRQFIMEQAQASGTELCRVVMEQFGITRQAVNKHLSKLKEQGWLLPEGEGKSIRYTLAALSSAAFSHALSADLQEDQVWSQQVAPLLTDLPDNVRRLWQHGFTEIFNNAIDHSGSSTIQVTVKRTAISTQITVADDGVGIFRKIHQTMHLLGERHAIFELSKGKLTTDPRNHSGEGIFFSSRMCDTFSITSGGLHFEHRMGDKQDWLIQNQQDTAGTVVFMEINNHSTRTTRQVFDEYSSGEDYAFNKTVIPVQLAQYGLDELVSRSQAKRLLARVDLFKTVLFDFKGVDIIGQGFADQIFRVFATEHPEIDLIPIRMNLDVENMVRRAVAQPR